jgi:hypothetical protein
MLSVKAGTEMRSDKRRLLFNLIGGAIVVLWLVLIGLLVRKVNDGGKRVQGRSATDAVAVETSPQQSWMEIYLEDRKVGYSVNKISELGENYLVREEIFLKLNLLGQTTDLSTVTSCVVDHAFVLKTFMFRMSSGAVTFKVTGSVKGNRMSLEIGDGVSRRQENVALSGPPVIGSAMPYFFKGRSLGVGQSFRFTVFDPSTLAQKEMKIHVAARESLTIRRLQYDALRLETEMWGQPMTFWLDEQGGLLKEKGLMGFTLIKSSVVDAPRGVEGSGGKDFYDLAAIGLKGSLPKPRRVTYLKLKAEGLEKTGFDTGILNRGRQRYRNGIIEIARERMPKKAGFNLPYPDPSTNMKPFLRPEVHIQSDARAIIDKARRISGKAVNPVFVARRLMLWLYRNVKKRPVVAVPNALDVLKTRVGDCNEHAVLLTAFLRAMGIPARQCVGIVYVRGGFYYHAWNEAYLGRWVSMDPTLNQMPVDATHIKLIEGGLDRQVEIIALIGKVKLEVRDYGYD